MSDIDKWLTKQDIVDLLKSCAKYLDRVLESDGSSNFDYLEIAEKARNMAKELKEEYNVELNKFLLK